MQDATQQLLKADARGKELEKQLRTAEQALEKATSAAAAPSGEHPLEAKCKELERLVGELTVKNEDANEGLKSKRMRSQCSKHSSNTKR